MQASGAKWDDLSIDFENVFCGFSTLTQRWPTIRGGPLRSASIWLAENAPPQQHLSKRRDTVHAAGGPGGAWPATKNGNPAQTSQNRGNKGRRAEVEPNATDPLKRTQRRTAEPQRRGADQRTTNAAAAAEQIAHRLQALLSAEWCSSQASEQQRPPTSTSTTKRQRSAQGMWPPCGTGLQVRQGGGQTHADFGRT